MDLTTVAKLQRRGIITALLITVILIANVLATPTSHAFGSSPASGVDVADWQHPDGADINWKDVKTDGQSFAIIKATEGQGYTNPFFSQDSGQAKAAGMHVGSYHFAKPGESAALQAANYANALRNQPQPSLPPVLDIETNDGLGPAEMQRWVKEFVTEIETLTGRKPIIYTYRYFWVEQMGDTTDFKNYPLWLAAYQDSVPTDLPGGWNYMTMWQRSDAGRVAGITGNTDMNLFNGTDADVASFAAGNHLNLGKILTPDFNASELLGSADLDALSKGNGELVGIILAIALGAVTVGALNDAANHAGFDAAAAQALVAEVQKLNDEGKLPVGDLKRMAETNAYNVGDLMILLDNAGR